LVNREFDSGFFSGNIFDISLNSDIFIILHIFFANRTKPFLSPSISNAELSASALNPAAGQALLCHGQPNRSDPIERHRLAILAAALVVLVGADMPDAIPLPERVPVPVPRPQAAEPADGNADTTAQPKTETQPQQTHDGEDKPADLKQAVEDAYVPPPIETEDPTDLKACLAELTALGVEFRPLPRIDDGDGCGIDAPITVTALGHGVALRPEGQMRCATALKLARWTDESVTPMLKTARPGATLAALNQASTYVCRKRNSATTGKISEHAHGNAVDIAGFSLAGGGSFTIKPRMQDSTMDGALQRAVTSAACLYFSTVLDPGSDAAHETHLHLDILARKNGYRYCW
jgi:hypothetical protein